MNAKTKSLAKIFALLIFISACGEKDSAVHVYLTTRLAADSEVGQGLYALAENAGIRLAETEVIDPNLRYVAVAGVQVETQFDYENLAELWSEPEEGVGRQDEVEGVHFGWYFNDGSQFETTVSNVVGLVRSELILTNLQGAVNAINYEPINILQSQFVSAKAEAPLIVSRPPLLVEGTIQIDGEWQSAIIEWVPLEVDPSFADVDGDLIGDEVDNCPLIFNPLQVNFDGDEAGDLCDFGPDDPSYFDEAGWKLVDFDADGIANGIDNCVNLPNPMQQDMDANNKGDACEPSPPAVFGIVVDKSIEPASKSYLLKAINRLTGVAVEGVSDIEASLEGDLSRVSSVAGVWGEFLYLADQWSDQISVVSLAERKVVASLSGGLGTDYTSYDDLEVHPSGQYLFASTNRELHVFDLNVSRETYRERVAGDVSISDGSYNSHLAVSPDGLHLYKSAGRTIELFWLGGMPLAEELEASRIEFDGEVLNFVQSPDGGRLFVALQTNAGRQVQVVDVTRSPQSRFVKAFAIEGEVDSTVPLMVVSGAREMLFVGAWEGDLCTSQSVVRGYDISSETLEFDYILQNQPLGIAASYAVVKSIQADAYLLDMALSEDETILHLGTAVIDGDGNYHGQIVSEPLVAEVERDVVELSANQFVVGLASDVENRSVQTYRNFSSGPDRDNDGISDFIDLNGCERVNGATPMQCDHSAKPEHSFAAGVSSARVGAGLSGSIDLGFADGQRIGRINAHPLWVLNWQQGPIDAPAWAQTRYVELSYYSTLAPGSYEYPDRDAALIYLDDGDNKSIEPEYYLSVNSTSRLFRVNSTQMEVVEGTAFINAFENALRLNLGEGDFVHLSTSESELQIETLRGQPRIEASNGEDIQVTLNGGSEVSVLVPSGETMPMAKLLTGSVSISSGGASVAGFSGPSAEISLAQPKVEAVSLPASIELGEGGDLSLEAPVLDINGDEVSVLWDLDGDGVFESEGPRLQIKGGDLVRLDEPTIRYQSCTDDDVCAVHEVTVTLLNDAPSIEANERQSSSRQSADLAFKLADSGQNEVHHVEVNWGDGTVEVNTITLGDKTLTHRYTDSGEYSVSLEVCDDRGACRVNAIELSVGADCGSITTPDYEHLGEFVCTGKTKVRSQQALDEYLTDYGERQAKHHSKKSNKHRSKKDPVRSAHEGRMKKQLSNLRIEFNLEAGAQIETPCKITFVGKGRRVEIEDLNLSGKKGVKIKGFEKRRKLSALGDMKLVSSEGRVKLGREQDVAADSLCLQSERRVIDLQGAEVVEYFDRSGKRKSRKSTSR